MRLAGSRTRPILVSPVICLVIALGLASCSDDSPSDPTAPADDTLEWKKCGDVECADLRVPRDHDDPASEDVVLPLSRLRAADDDKRVGVLLVNPGGPGAPGSSLPLNAAYYFSRDIIDSFDIVSWDPRGTGKASDAVDCIDDYSQYFTVPFTTESARSFIDDCVAANGANLSLIDTVSSARDIDAIRRALGEPTISYFGFSYGGLLGATWASLFPDTVRAAVFDAPPSPVTTRAERIFAQAEGFERQLDRFLAAEQLTEQVDALLTAPPEPLTAHMVRAAIVSALYDDESWMVLADAIEAAVIGETQPMLDLYNGYYYQDEGYEDYRNVFEASVAIACLDDDSRTQIPDLTDVALRLGAFFAPDHLCTQWPEPAASRPDISAKTTRDIVVIGATGDPATPLDGVQAMAKTLGNSALITVEANRHTTYLANDCVTALVDDYLIDLEVPTKTRC
jgi:pimeloyl-ACP methyl ester carboxylesterase